MQLVCGQCGHALQVEDSMSGNFIDCPQCAARIEVPCFDPATMPPAILTASPGAMEVTLDDIEDTSGFAELARSSASRQVQVICGHCKKRLQLSARRSGKKERCPACNTTILIPYPDDEDIELTALNQISESSQSLDLTGSQQPAATKAPPLAAPDELVLDEESLKRSPQPAASDTAAAVTNPAPAASVKIVAKANASPASTQPAKQGPDNATAVLANPAAQAAKPATAPAKPQRTPKSPAANKKRSSRTAPRKRLNKKVAWLLAILLALAVIMTAALFMMAEKIRSH